MWRDETRRSDIRKMIFLSLVFAAGMIGFLIVKIYFGAVVMFLMLIGLIHYHIYYLKKY